MFFLFGVCEYALGISTLDSVVCAWFLGIAGGLALNYCLYPYIKDEVNKLTRSSSTVTTSDYMNRAIFASLIFAI